MITSYVFSGMLLLSLVCGIATGKGAALSAAAMDGAAAGIRLALSLAGSLCLWSGIKALLEETGGGRILSRLCMPLLGKIFPDCRTNGKLAAALSGNFAANLLGLGNAATPLGIEAARRLAGSSGEANDQLCRLIVLNTASIQIIPTTIAALRASLGSGEPFAILVPVWISSLFSAGVGLSAAWLLGRVWKT